MNQMSFHVATYHLALTKLPTNNDSFPKWKTVNANAGVKNDEVRNDGNIFVIFSIVFCVLGIIIALRS